MTHKIQFYDGISALPQDATLQISQSDLRIVLPERIIECDISQIKIDENFGGKRRVYISNHEYFLDLGSATAEIHRIHHKTSNAVKFLIERLESRWSLVLCCFILLTLAGLIFVKTGIPFLSLKISGMIPVNISKTIGIQTLIGLDQIQLTEASRIPSDQQENIRRKYLKICSNELPEDMCRLEFRHSSHSFLSYNAFAAPGGLSVLLDGMYDIAENDKEILSILLHELGHQRHNHSLQRLIESSIYTVSLAMFLGDVSSISGIATAAPAAIIQAQHSQSHETEADDWGLEIMRKNQISTIHFANIMQRLADKFKLCENSKCKDERYSLLNSHPGISSRINKARLLASE